MTEKTVKISKKVGEETKIENGKKVIEDKIEQVEVGLAYCYATEIAFKDRSDGDITDFMQEVSESISQQRMPDIKKTLYLIIAAHMAYTQAKGITEPAVKESDLMTASTPDEVGTALGTIIALHAEFYHVPSGEPEDKPEGKKGKGKRKNA